MVNPFDSPKLLTGEKGVFADNATLKRKTFLYREIDFDRPFSGTLIYDGWWFWQRVTINGVLVWSKISWLRIEPSICFKLPDSQGDIARTFTIDIHFGFGLSIRRFQVTVDGIIAYDEIC